MAQVSTVQVTAYDAATTYRLTIGNKTVSTINQGTVNATASALATNWNAASSTQYPEFAEVTASVATDTVTLTADQAGKPFTCTSSVSGGAGTIGAVTTTTTSSGPNDWSTAANWSDNAVPAGGDTVHIDDGNWPILYGFAQSAVTLAALHVWASFTGQIGLPKWNGGGYAEYRADFLAISATILKIGAGPGPGSGRIKIDTGANATTLDVERTAPSLEAGVPACLWKGAHASNSINVVRGDAGFAFFGGETATIPTLRVGFISRQLDDATVFLGAGVTLTTVNQLGGRLEVNSNFTTANIRGGECTIKGTATLTTLNLGVLDPKNPTKALCNYNTTGALTTANVYKGGTLDFTKDMKARTATTVNAYPGATVLNRFQAATITTLTYAGGATPAEVIWEQG